jgi:predicted DNA-binding transcriptional regulator AlpA
MRDLTPKMISRREAAKMFGVSYGTLSNWLSQGKGPRAFKIGKKKVLYAIADLEEFFMRQPVQTFDSNTMEFN